MILCGLYCNKNIYDTTYTCNIIDNANGCRLATLIPVECHAIIIQDFRQSTDFYIKKRGKSAKEYYMRTVPDRQKWISMMTAYNIIIYIIMYIYL